MRYPLPALAALLWLLAISQTFAVEDEKTRSATGHIVDSAFPEIVIVAVPIPSAKDIEEALTLFKANKNEECLEKMFRAGIRPSQAGFQTAAMFVLAIGQYESTTALLRKSMDEKRAKVMSHQKDVALINEFLASRRMITEREEVATYCWGEFQTMVRAELPAKDPGSIPPAKTQS